MRTSGEFPDANPSVWTETDWTSFERKTRTRILEADHPASAWKIAIRASRKVMRTYTTSFFIVSRFLPRLKRDRVEAIYAAVRYPDEVVDTFPLSPDERLQRLDTWADAYETALKSETFRASLENGVPFVLATFREVMRSCDIPAAYYRSFLDAMRLDARPGLFQTLDDLVDRYIYGSAIVVGYFLTHAYGAEKPDLFPRALESARDLAIGLQLTNFLRDVSEDRRRGRMYLPQEFLRAEGIEQADPRDPAHHAAFGRVVKALAVEADGYYRKAERNLSGFAADSRIAIKACIDVYGLLNRQILESDRGILHRESVPLRLKLQPLPASKYWRIPLAYLVP